MVRVSSYRPRNPNSEDLEDRPRGIVTLESRLLPRGEARKLDAERWAAKETEERCQAALDFAADRSRTGGLPFDENSKIALKALGTGEPKALQITDAGMKLADDFYQRNKNLLTDANAVPEGTIGKLNFGAGALSEGFGETINGPRPDPLGALLGNASVMIDANGKIVGISDQFDYDPSNHGDSWIIKTAMGIVNDRITRDCADRVPYVPINGGRSFPTGGGRK